MNNKIWLARAFKKLLSPHCKRIEIAGSIRRKEKNIKDIDFVVIPKSKEDIRKIIQQTNWYIYRNGDKILSFKASLCNVDIYFATEDNWGAMLLFATGSGGHNIGLRRIAKHKFGWLLNQYGLWNGKECIASKTEEDIYKALEREYKSPELRK